MIYRHCPSSIQDDNYTCRIHFYFDIAEHMRNCLDIRSNLKFQNFHSESQKLLICLSIFRKFKRLIDHTINPSHINKKSISLKSSCYRILSCNIYYRIFIFVLTNIHHFFYIVFGLNDLPDFTT